METQTETQIDENSYTPHNLTFSEYDDNSFMSPPNLTDTSTVFSMPSKSKPKLTDTEDTFFMPTDTSNLNLLESVEEKLKLNL